MVASGGGGDTVEHRGRKQGRGDGALKVPRHRCGPDEAAIQACARETLAGGKSGGRPRCAERHHRGYAATPAHFWDGASSRAVLHCP